MDNDPPSIPQEDQRKAQLRTSKNLASILINYVEEFNPTINYKIAAKGLRPH